MKNVHFSPLLAAIFMISLGLLMTGARSKDVTNPDSVAAPPSHQIWDQLLQAHVTSTGSVDYQGFVKDKAKLASYLELLDQHVPQSDWTRKQAMAYWINAYNAFTVNLIVSHYPLKSIRDLKEPWDRKNIQLGGKTYSLNDIEHKILRERYKDARIHFAVNCAALSCPPLYNRAFTAEKLNSQLQSRTSSFIRSNSYNQIGTNGAKLSQIFNWYRADFEQEGSLVSYLNAYSTQSISEGASIEFLNYDWKLNGK